MRTYLVTGGAGFIGSNYIHYMLKKYDNEIRIINVDKLKWVLSHMSVESVYSDGKFLVIKTSEYDWTKELFKTSGGSCDLSLKMTVSFNALGEIELDSCYVESDYWLKDEYDFYAGRFYGARRSECFEDMKFEFEKRHYLNGGVENADEPVLSKCLEQLICRDKHDVWVHDQEKMEETF